MVAQIGKETEIAATDLERGEGRNSESTARAVHRGQYTEYDYSDCPDDPIELWRGKPEHNLEMCK